MVWYRVKQGGLKIHFLMEVILDHALNFLIGRKERLKGLGLRMWWSWVIMVFKIWFSIKRTMDVIVDRVKQQWFRLVVFLLWWLVVVKRLILVQKRWWLSWSRWKIIEILNKRVW